MSYANALTANMSTLLDRQPRFSTKVFTSSRQRNILSNRSNTSKKLHSKAPNVILGKGRTSAIKVAPGSRKNHQRRNNRTIIGVFVSRLHPKTSSHSIDQHIYRETGVSVSSEKLDTKYNHYSSFFIRGDKRMRDQLLHPDLWPEGTLLKPYED